MPDHHVFSDGFVPPSAISALRFPAFPHPRMAVAHSLLAQMAESQWWTPEKMRSHQLEQLDALLRYSVEHTAYGRRYFKNTVVAPLTWERWQEQPILTRKILQSRRRKLLAENVPKSFGQAPPSQTSGSSGIPVRVERTDLDVVVWEVLTARDHLWHGRDTSQPMSTIRHRPGAEYPNGQTTPQWGGAANLIGPKGKCHILHVNATTKQQLEWLQRRETTYLLVYPSGLRDLLELSRKTGQKVPGLQEVRTFGEVVTPELRDEVRETWGVPLRDIYSTQEQGYIGLECPVSGHFHVPAESVLVEVLREDGTPCEVGETGRVVVTSLHNFAMPLIRYEIGDFAVLGGPCPCGRGLPVLERVLGRVHQTFLTASGDKIWLTVGVHKLRDMAPVVQHQFVQHKAGELHLNLLPSREPTASEEAALRDFFLDGRLPEGTVLHIHWVDDIPRAQNGKFYDFISNV